MGTWLPQGRVVAARVGVEELIDWGRRADHFVRFTLDPTRKGDYPPLLWWDDTSGEGGMSSPHFRSF